MVISSEFRKGSIKAMTTGKTHSTLVAKYFQFQLRNPDFKTVASNAFLKFLTTPPIYIDCSISGFGRPVQVWPPWFSRWFFLFLWFRFLVFKNCIKKIRISFNKLNHLFSHNIFTRDSQTQERFQIVQTESKYMECRMNEINFLISLAWAEGGNESLLKT